MRMNGFKEVPEAVGKFAFENYPDYPSWRAAALRN